MTEPTTAEPEAEPEVEALLDLETMEPKRQIVTIDKQHYELKTYADFGIADQQWLSQAGREYQRLWDKKQLSNNEKAKLKVLLDKMSDMVLDAPKEIINKLKDWQRAQVVLAFTVAPLVNVAAEAPEPAWDPLDDEPTLGS
jgi:hypothetical protein